MINGKNRISSKTFTTASLFKQKLKSPYSVGAVSTPAKKRNYVWHLDGWS